LSLFSIILQNFIELPIYLVLSLSLGLPLFLIIFYAIHKFKYPHAKISILVSILTQLITIAFNIWFLKFLQGVLQNNDFLWVFYLSLFGPIIAFVFNFIVSSYYLKKEIFKNEEFSTWKINHKRTYVMTRILCVLDTRNVMILISGIFGAKKFMLPISEDLLVHLGFYHVIQLIFSDCVIFSTQIYICLRVQSFLTPSSLAFVATSCNIVFNIIVGSWNKIKYDKKQKTQEIEMPTVKMGDADVGSSDSFSVKESANSDIGNGNLDVGNNGITNPHTPTNYDAHNNNQKNNDNSNNHNDSALGSSNSDLGCGNTQ